MALSEEQRREILDRKFNESPLAQRLMSQASALAKEERSKVKLPEGEEWWNYTPEQSIQMDRPTGEQPQLRDESIEVQDKEGVPQEGGQLRIRAPQDSEEFLPTQGEILDAYDIQEQTYQDEQQGRPRRPGDIDNQYLRPLKKTVRGIDVATGERVLTRGDFDNPEAAESYRTGVDLIRRGGFNTREGLNENALRGIAAVANGIQAEGLDKGEFLRAIDNLGVPRAQADMAWSAAQGARVEGMVEDYIASDFDAAEVETLPPEPIPDIDKEELPTIPGWEESARTVYEMDNGEPFRGTSEDLIGWYIDEMSNFNWKVTQYGGDWAGVDTSSMSSYVWRAMKNGPEYASALSNLINTYDRVNTDWSIVGNSVAALAGDPLSIIGLGGGFIGARVGAQVAKQRLKTLLAEAGAKKATEAQARSAGRRGLVAGGAAAGSFEGTVFTAADETARQKIEIEAGYQEEYDAGDIALAGGAGAVVGAGLGAGISYAGPKLVSGGRRVGRRMLENARSTRGPMYRQIGAVGDVGNMRLPLSSTEEWSSHPNLRNAFNFADAGTFRNNRELKRGLQELAKITSQRAGVYLAQDSVESNALLRKMFVEDAKTALVSNQNAIGWYDRTVGAAVEILSEIHPELKTSDESRFAFTYALAVTSNGLKVDKNFELAEIAYRQWKDTGKMPSDVGTGTASKAMNESLELYNDLVATHGVERLAEIMDQQWTVKQLEAVFGVKVTGENQGALVRGAAVLGPKIGNGFFSNLNGRFDALTMDRWFMRSWGRLSGNLIEERPDMVKKKRGELRDLIGKMRKKDPEAVKAFEALGVKFNLNDLPGTAKAIQKASMLPENRLVMNKTDLGEETRKTGNSLHKWILGDKEAPRNGAERERIRGVFKGVLSDLQGEYPDLTMSDLQALLWYPEKRLYDKAKTSDDVAEGYADDEAPDYANAAAKLAERMGIDEAAIREADQRGRTRGTRRAVEPTEEAQREGAKARRDLLRYRAFAKGRPGSEGGSKVRGYKGGSEKAARGLQGVLKVYEPSKNYQSFLAAAEMPAVTLHELDPATQSGAFEALLRQSKESSRFGAAVYVYPVEDYAGMRLFVTPDSAAGFAVKEDGDIVSVFSAGGGQVFSMLELAVTQGGGTKLDAFETVLPEIYALAGFKEVDRMPWSDEYMPDDWDKEVFAAFNSGEPDVVMMEYDPKYVPESRLDPEPETGQTSGQGGSSSGGDEPGIIRSQAAREPAVDQMGDPVAAFRRVAENENVGNALYDELDFLQPDMTPEDFMAAMEEESVSPATKRLMKALNRDDWLGFDSPSQALDALMRDDVNMLDLSSGLKSALGRYANEVTGG